MWDRLGGLSCCYLVPLSQQQRLVPTPALHHMIARWNLLRCKAGWAISSPIWVSVNSPAKHEVLTWNKKVKISKKTSVSWYTESHFYDE
jgi:hypothetical protein